MKNTIFKIYYLILIYCTIIFISVLTSLFLPHTTQFSPNTIHSKSWTFTTCGHFQSISYTSKLSHIQHKSILALYQAISHQYLFCLLCSTKLQSIEAPQFSFLILGKVCFCRIISLSTRGESLEATLRVSCIWVYTIYSKFSYLFKNCGTILLWTILLSTIFLSKKIEFTEEFSVNLKWDFFVFYQVVRVSLILEARYFSAVQYKSTYLLTHAEIIGIV